jgi:hypothetical protein
LKTATTGFYRVRIPKNYGTITYIGSAIKSQAAGNLVTRSPGIYGELDKKLTGSATWKYNTTDGVMYTVEQGDVVLALKLRNQGGGLHAGTVSGSGFHVNGASVGTDGALAGAQQFIIYNNSNAAVDLKNKGECTFLFVKLYG